MTDKAGQLNMPRELKWRYSDFLLIGRGGVGVIVSAMDTLLNKRIAIKLLPSNFDNALDEVRFQQEAKTISKLNHPNVVQILDFGVSENRPYLVMEYIVGSDLEQLLAKQGALRPAQALQIAIHVSLALKYAHTQNIIHRDLKPQNIMLDENNNVKVLDFSLARILNTAETDWRKTRPGDPKSLFYMSPEQLRGEAVDERSDIYGLGLLIVKMLTGTVPFASDDVVELLRQRQEATPPALPRSDGQAVARALEKIAKKALEFKPESRFSNMAEVCRRLEDLSNSTDSTSRINDVKNSMEFSQPNIKTKRGEQSEARGEVPGFLLALVVLIIIGGTVFAFAKLFWLDGDSDSSKRLSRTQRLKPAGERIPDGFKVEFEQNQQFFKANKDVEDEDLKRLRGSGITYLSFQGNKLITDQGMLEIAGLPLEGLVLREARVGDGGIEKINSFANLRWLDLQGTNITNEGLLQLRPSKNLTSLELRYLRVNDYCLEYIAKSFPHLLHLGLSDTKVTASGLSALRSLKYLRSVYVGALNLTDDDIDKIVDLNVDTIDLSSNPITDRGLAKLKRAKSLRWVGLEFCQQLSPSAIKDLESSFRNIEVRHPSPPDAQDG
ncbi:MAG: protein kinase [Candidatus Obscuribacterales bacterium]|nr:protein kinase [Candidatus Obscuribacterales bacterium]